ncbi:hypothetical protein FPV67DRAFT_1664024 [Lyophyllum atratum]|nr:hypothetical protein FPV67DRAFT_1664024 [Lyophyllum atratum]
MTSEEAFGERAQMGSAEQGASVWSSEVHRPSLGRKTNPFLHSFPSGRRFNPLDSHPTFAGPQTPQGVFTAVQGNQNSYPGSVISTNSGNTITRIVSDSNNDSSVGTYHTRERRDQRLQIRGY